jgi:hypothetical protein
VPLALAAVALAVLPALAAAAAPRRIPAARLAD